MWTYALPVLLGLFTWWFTTGAVLWLVQSAGRLPPAIVPAVAAGLFGGSLVALHLTCDDIGSGPAITAFTGAILAWAAQEIAFLQGWVTGPWRRPCPGGADGWRRAALATSAILYHELALLGSAALVAAVTWGGRNQVGLWTFGALLLMRVSAKLNLFLGIPHVTDGFLPPPVAHLKTFFRRRPMNLLFPVSVTVLTVAVVRIADAALVASSEEAFGYALLATIVALGLLEHWFFVLPFPVEWLWAWRGNAVEPHAPAQLASAPAERVDDPERLAGGPGYPAPRSPRLGVRAQLTASE